MTQIKTSIRALVEYVYRSGSLDRRFKSTTSLTEGTKAHQMVQKEYGEEDFKEMHLAYTHIEDSLEIQIEGRCDGLLQSTNTITIDEIKSTSSSIFDIKKDSHPVHWAQAKCYAFIYATQQGLDEIDVQLTYVHLPSSERKQFAESFTANELKEWFEHVIKAYIPYAEQMSQHRDKRQQSIQQLPFPYPEFRPGQRKFAGAVYKTISDHKTMFAHAPTGTGKTISTLFPAIKAIGEGRSEKLFYLTAKTITRQAAEEALHLMEESGLHFHTVTVTAKDKMCFTSEGCQAEYCPFADGYYDRINHALLDILSSETLMTREVIEYYARKHQVCPFEYSIDVAYHADSIICDYNYVFDPRVSFKRLWNDTKKKTTLLIDEAHNLVDRSQAMYSSLLTKSSFLQLKREYKTKNPHLYQALHTIDQSFLSLKKSMGDDYMLTSAEIPEGIVEQVEQFTELAELEIPFVEDTESLLLETYFMALSFIRISKFYDESYLSYIRRYKSEVELKLFCIDPSSLLHKTTKGYGATIFFSATFAPFDYYKDMLGWTEGDYTFSIPSPFDRDKVDLFIQPTSTRYYDREESAETIAHTIEDLIRERPGNYLIFFPSYVYMEQVYERFQERDHQSSVLLQTPHMTEEDREHYLSEFRIDREDSLIGFAVLGGIFSEGVDLRGNRLNGVLVVSVGLPKLNDEQDLMKQFFNNRGKNGFDYAYMYPGMNKVLQAAGRLIRTEEDSGTIVLIDDRFLQKRYTTLLPYHLQHYRIKRDE
ncbi:MULTISPECIES: helicase C-terminal domain-containing protein [Pontibacillus]|uniref:Helicase C-terminal domain-containing protein n=1 Tax=Pontibacillus chungwhensis TaxID=265426 RepID=A0ABY8UXW3_9BACI|nr:MULTISPECIES: helicase C-terminal domain-containing protein [Pontibacillus]MCD5323882.1 ATP-dependent DNA helicase [Pontibacillus sp. HN14]WIF97240.1 helicase C-terminal domain-containing protein [Pontibacillus chungwhensis]